jgi:hypothetical protein
MGRELPGLGNTASQVVQLASKIVTAGILYLAPSSTRRSRRLANSWPQHPGLAA